MSDATTPAVVQDAQQYDWGYDEGNGDEACFTLTSDDGLNKRTEAMVFGGAAEYLFDLIVQRDSLVAYIERLEAERDALLAVVEAAKNAEDTVSNVIDCGDNVREFMGEDSDYLFIDAALATALGDAIDTHDNAERVTHSE